jgi:polysaccharide biosynthesis protein PslA
VNQHLKTAGLTPATSARRWVFGRLGFAASLLAAEFVLIIGCAVVTGVGYHIVSYDDTGDVSQFANVGLLTAMLFTTPMVFRDDLKFQNFLDGKRSPMRTFMLWTYAFLCLALIGFLTKTTGVFSRGWLAAFFMAGLGGVIALEARVCQFVSAALAQGRIASRRLMLIGNESDIRAMSLAVQSPAVAFRVVATALFDMTTPPEALARAVDKARLLGVDDVVILTNWSRGDLIQDVVNAFSELPVTVHLGASNVIGTFSDARIARFGQASALSLTLPPLTPMQAAAKRCFDVVLAGLAIILLSPVLAVIAALVKWDSAGPVFFRQRRRGYNLVEFKIWKFRTMTTMDDGDIIEQAKPGDVRVTRIGQVLRRYNLDELPQLFNVITGDMSLVGPRPHAVAHDRLFETRIAKYRRRLNVRPGITGWAQVNGFRGPTETEDAMRARVEHDLYYIDNWSILFDIYLLVATVVSRKAFTNAH